MIEVVKGGLIIDLGVRGFLPASLVDIRRVQNLDEFLGTKIECKVIELNRSRNNVVLSRRAVLEEERKEVRQQILDRLQPGMIVEGAISNIVDFGAFVDLDGIDGLIHISELSWSHVNHPSEILAIGDVVPVKVLDIDRDRQRISLGLKQTQEDPWQRVIDTYRVGDELEGKVTKVVTFGAFVEIMDGVEGLVHISELAHHHVENPREILEPGQDVRVKILEIDSERRRLSLSVKRVAEQLPHIKSAAAAGAAAAGVSEEIGDVPDLGPVRGRLRRAAGERRRRPARRRGRLRQPRGGRGGPAAAGRRGGAAAEPEATEEAPPEPEAAEAAAAAGGRGGRRRSPRVEAEAGRRPSPRRRVPGGVADGPVRGADRRTGRRQVRGLADPGRAGASTLSTDAVVHELLATDEVQRALAERFGRRRGVRPLDLIAERVFGDESERAWLEGLLWPLVGKRVVGVALLRCRPTGWRLSRSRCCSSRAWRPSSTRRSPWSRRRRSASSGPPRAVTPPWPSAPGASSPRRKRRRERTSRCATTARSTS